jgi:hypothetical protein
MDEFIGRLVTDFGVDRPTIEKASGIILDFLAKEGPPGKVQALLAKLPGAQGLMRRAADESGDGGMGGVMGPGMRLMAAGLSVEQAQDIDPAVRRLCARESRRGRDRRTRRRHSRLVAICMSAGVFN